jgi:hypothetical protein
LIVFLAAGGIAFDGLHAGSGTANDGADVLEDSPVKGFREGNIGFNEIDLISEEFSPSLGVAD